MKLTGILVLLAASPVLILLTYERPGTSLGNDLDLAGGAAEAAGPAQDELDLNHVAFESSGEDVPLFLSQEFIQGARLGATGSALVVVDKEWDPQADTYVESETTIPAGFAVHTAKARVADELYVAGRKRNG